MQWNLERPQWAYSPLPTKKNATLVGGVGLLHTSKWCRRQPKDSYNVLIFIYLNKIKIIMCPIMCPDLKMIIFLGKSFSNLPKFFQSALSISCLVLDYIFHFKCWTYLSDFFRVRLISMDLITFLQINRFVKTKILLMRYKNPPGLTFPLILVSELQVA